MKCGSWPIAVCSWSLHTDIHNVIEKLKEISIEHVHLALSPALGYGGDEYLNVVRNSNLKISSTMIDFPQEDYSSLETIKITGGIAPDKYWDKNRELTFKAIDITAELNVKYLSFHAGFIDYTQPEYADKFFDRMKTLADTAGEKNVILLMETGQETAEELQKFLEELNHPALAVNFDPANMILYGKGDPVRSLQILKPWIKHIHIKDALKSEIPGTWGTEVPWTHGQVQTNIFLDTLRQIGFEGTLAIERESGSNRLEDIKQAAQSLKNWQ